MSEDIQGVNPASPTGEGREPLNQIQTVVDPAEGNQPQKPPKGFVPYQALEEERKKRKDIEAERDALKSAPPEDSEVYSDEGRVLSKEISTLNEKLRLMERKDARREAESEFPVLRDKKEEFEAFLEDDENKRLSIKKAAKLFLAEKGLLTQDPPERKGLEKPTSGQNPSEPGLTDEQKETIRKTNYREYEKLLRQGKI